MKFAVLLSSVIEPGPKRSGCPVGLLEGGEISRRSKYLGEIESPVKSLQAANGFH